MTKSNGDARTVLVIDDEPDVVTYLEMVLQDDGYKTVSAANGKIGLEMLEKERPDLICLDITMPEESGIRFYRKLREHPELAKTPVLVVTAVTGLGGRPEPFEQFLGSRKWLPAPEGFFSKPIDRDEFLGKVKEVLAAGK
jgi:CheY-like chemotaxis protein